MGPTSVEMRGFVHRYRQEDDAVSNATEGLGFRTGWAWVLAGLLVAGCGGHSSSSNRDAGSGDGGGGDVIEDTAAFHNCDANTQCFTPLPSAGVFPRLLIQSVQFGPVDRVVLKNVSGDDIDFTGWFICRRPNYQQLPDGFILHQVGTVTIHLGESGTNTDSDIFIDTFTNLTADDEIAVFQNGDDFDNPDNMVAYVRWGSPANGETRESEAVTDQLWSSRQYVPVCGDNQGIVAVGDVTIPHGWKDEPASCF
jgi:hypothetical protein